jgi:hypothetical protein
VPVALGALARAIRAFRLVLLLGLVPAIYYWIEVAVLDPSYDLARLDQLVFPAFFALAFVVLWCLLAYVGRAAREAGRSPRTRSSSLGCTSVLSPGLGSRVLPLRRSDGREDRMAGLCSSSNVKVRLDVPHARC